ncbi:anti-sigma factor domain-containing protein [Microbacterium hominis]|uniref:Anti-sigma factor n=1 Tax=Microbacterium hominis TaxID=162426 RepID=A0A7D4Q001_9MICO|nr:anti-sigma factor [Microbacterium hominis]QKJ18792.1 anti-sigma factor [Microbacterium hominis]
MAIDGGVPSARDSAAADHVGELLVRVADGDQRAFARVYDLLSRRAYGVILSAVGEPATSEATLQEAFLEVWRTASSFDPSREVGRPWVLGLVQRRALAAAAERGEDATPGPEGDAAPPLGLRSRLLARISDAPQAGSAAAQTRAARRAAAATAGAGETGATIGGTPPGDGAEPTAPGAEAAATEDPATEVTATGAAAALLTPAATRPAATHPGAAAPGASAPALEPAPTTTVMQAIERRNWTQGLLILAAALVGLTVLGFASVTVNEYLNRPEAVQALERIEASDDGRSATTELTEGGIATAYWSAAEGEAVVVTEDLPTLTSDQDFELWLFREGAAIRAGIVEPATTGETVALLDARYQDGDEIQITIEPAGGSPEDVPSGTPIFVVPTATG